MDSDGMTSYCKDAVMRLLQYGDRIVSAKILSTPSGPESKSHAMVLNVDDSYSVAIKAGFTSGYLGTGPSGFSSILKLLHDHKVEMSEYDVGQEFMDRLNALLLTNKDIEMLEKMRPVRPSQIFDYIFESDWKKNQWEEFPNVIPFAIVDSRIVDLAMNFSDNADDSLMKGYRRLEDIVRERTGIDDHGVKLFQQAFVRDAAKLTWNEVSQSERVVLVARSGLKSRAFIHSL
jgi:hypothetical protein